MAATTLTTGASSPFGISGSLGQQFPNPFDDMSSQAMPHGHRNALLWAEFIWNHNGTYRMAMSRVVSYFLTRIDVKPLHQQLGLGEDEKEKWKHFLNEQLGITNLLQAVGVDRECYGNSFSSVLVPFRRFLGCPKCFSRYPLKVVAESDQFKFRWEDMRFHATCPHCEYDGRWDVKDEVERDESKLKVKRWNPHEIEIIEDPFTGDMAYVWKIPEEYRRLIRQGTLHHIERINLRVLDAVRKNQLFRFAPNVIYHMKEPTLAGFRARGWGISRTLLNFRQIWYVQVMHRYNEALALDYIVPFRVLTPEVRTGSGVNSGMGTDPLLTMNMGDFSAQVRGMLRRRRRDPATWHTLPFPIRYSALGGDATQLAPRDLLDQGVEILLNNAGTPVEMFKGTLTLQAAPVALRLFESTWSSLVYQNNDFLRWLCHEVAQIMQWEAVGAVLEPVTYADDVSKQLAILQLMSGQAVSGTTGLRALGIDWKGEQRMLAEEARFQAEEQARMQEEMDQAAAGQALAKGQPPGAQAGGAPAGGAPPGGAPAGGAGDPAAAGAGGQPQPGAVSAYLQSGSGSVPSSPDEMLETANSLAMQLLAEPESQRRSELMQLKQQHEVLWHLVKGQLQTIRSQARSAGQQQVLAQSGLAAQ